MLIQQAVGVLSGFFENLLHSTVSGVFGTGVLQFVEHPLQLLEKELFQRGIHRLIITCDVNNQASAAVARRCGFELEGKMREARFAYGSYRDELLFAKINPGK